MKIKTFTLIAGLAIASHAQAATTFTYVDATPSNTTLDGVALVASGATPNYVAGTGSSSDNLWSYRDTAAYASGFYFESDGSSSLDENTGNLVTTITLGAVGTYDIIVLFDNNSGRDIAAKIGSAPDSSNVFVFSNSTDRADLTLSANYDNTRSQMRAGFLPQFTSTSAGQSVQVFVNGLEESGSTTVNRTQYDGVAFALVPEPSTALLGAIGALMLLRRRRN